MPSAETLRHFQSPSSAALDEKGIQGRQLKVHCIAVSVTG